MDEYEAPVTSLRKKDMDDDRERLREKKLHRVGAGKQICRLDLLVRYLEQETDDSG